MWILNVTLTTTITHFTFDSYYKLIIIDIVSFFLVSSFETIPKKGYNFSSYLSLMKGQVLVSKQEMLKIIENKRAELIDIVQKNGLNSTISIEYSQELDKL